MDQLFEVTHEAAWTVGSVASVPLVILLLISITTAVLQAITNVHDPVISAVPRLLGLGALACLAGPWAVSRLAEFLILAFRTAGSLGG